MIIKKTVEIPAKPAERKEIVDKTVCDLCGYTESSPPEYGGGVDWDTRSFDHDLVTVTRNVKCVYPEGGWGSIEAWHVCPDCYETKLAPWLKSQAKSGPHLSDQDY